MKRSAELNPSASLSYKCADEKNTLASASAHSTQKQGGRKMRKRPISVRIIGDPSGIATAMDDARIACVRKELDKYPTSEQSKIIDMVHARYSAPC